MTSRCSVGTGFTENSMIGHQRRPNILKEVRVMRRKVLRTTLLGVGMSVVAALMAITTASAQLKPGDVITPENASKVKSLSSPVVYYIVQHGIQMNIVSTQPLQSP